MSSAPRSTSAKITGKRTRKAAALPSGRALTKRAINSQSYGAKGNKYTLSKYQVDAFGEAEQNLIYQKLDPENAKVKVREPSNYGGTSIMCTKNVQNAIFADDDTSSVFAFPSERFTLSATIRPTPADDFLPPTSQQPPSLTSTQQVVTYPGNATYLSSPAIFPSGLVLYPTNERASSLSSPQDSCFYYVQFSFSAAALAAFNAMTDPTSTLSFSFRGLMFPNGANVQISSTISGTTTTQLTGINLLAGTLDVLSLTKGNLNAAFQNTPFVAGVKYNLAFSFAVRTQGENTSAQGEIGWRLNPSSIAAVAAGLVISPPPIHNLHKIVPITDIGFLIANASHSTVISQSLLCTSTSSQDTDGGIIATARLPGGRRPGGGNVNGSADWYSFVAGLPYNAYDGAARDGSYTWWLPKDPTSYKMRSLQDVERHPSKENYMIAVMKANELNSTFRIKVVTVISYVSNSSSSEQAVASYLPNYQNCMLVLGLCNSSYENGRHTEQLKQYLKKASRYIGSQAKRLAKDPSTYEKIAKGIIQYGPTIAKGAAMLI